MLENKHLLGLEGYPGKDIQTIIEKCSEKYAQIKMFDKAYYKKLSHELMHFPQEDGYYLKFHQNQSFDLL